MNEKLYKSYKLGKTAEEIHIDTAEENKTAVIALAKQAHYSIDIFSQDMDAEIYNNKYFEQAIFNLAKKHPNTKIRILTQDSKKAVSSGHRLIKLAQNITSSVFINNPSREYKSERNAFLIVDRLGLLHRPSANNRNYKASLNFMAPQHAEKLLDYFNEAWEHSTPDIQTRRLHV